MSDRNVSGVRVVRCRHAKAKRIPGAEVINIDQSSFCYRCFFAVFWTHVMSCPRCWKMLKASNDFHFQYFPININTWNFIKSSPGRSPDHTWPQFPPSRQVTMTNLTRVKGPMAISFNKALETLSDFDSLQQALDHCHWQFLCASLSRQSSLIYIQSRLILSHPILSYLILSYLILSHLVAYLHTHTYPPTYPPTYLHFIPS